MRSEERTLSVLEEIQAELEYLKEDMDDDGFEEYADSLQDSIERIKNLHYILTNGNQELPLGV